jgi:glutathione reductase (NADPH)
MSNIDIDVLIIGSGSGAQAVAYPCRKAGLSVALVDSRPFGGTCELRGCEPKKILANAGELVDWARRMRGKGIAASDLAINWHDLIQYKRSFTDPVPGRTEQSFEQSGIKAYHGRAHFVAANTIQIGADRVTGRYTVIAAGARHAELHIPGEEYLITSTQFMELEQMPQRVVFIGGGYIAFEFAHVAARVGAQVHIINRSARPLSKFEPELVDLLVQESNDIGARVHLNTSLQSVERHGNGFLVNVRKDGQERQLAADLVVHAAGRVPEIDDLHLEVAGIARQRMGVSVNEYLQSVSQPSVYAAGDAAASGGWPLTPVAQMQGGIVAKNIIEGNKYKPNYSGIPSVVYTTPTMTRVGLGEEEARKQGLDFNAYYQDTSSWYTSRRVALAHSGFKTLVEKGSDRVLGAHLLGLHAEEIINVFAVAIRAGLKSSDLVDTIYAFPTAASDISSMFS